MPCFYIETKQQQDAINKCKNKLTQLSLSNADFSWSALDFISQYAEELNLSEEDKTILQEIMTSDNFESMKNLLIDSKVTFDSLNFLHSDFNDQMNTALNTLEQNHDASDNEKVGKIGVSKYLDQQLSQSDIANRQLKINQKFAQLFQQGEEGFGTLVHEYLQANLKDRDIILLKMLKRINEFRNKYNDLTSQQKEEFQQSNYISFVKFLEKFGNINNISTITNLSEITNPNSIDKINGLRDQLEILVQKLEEVYPSSIWNKRYEQKMAIKIPSTRQWLRGRIDAIYYDNNNNVRIIDFKTSVNSGVSNLSFIRKALQLQIYKHMLASQLNIPLNQIQLYNLNLIYSENGIEASDNNFLTDMNEDTISRQLSNNDLIRMNRVIKDTFFNIEKDITDQDQVNLARKTDDQFQFLFSDRTLNKLDATNLQNDLNWHQTRNMPYYFYSKERLCSIKKEEDGTYTIFYTDNRGVEVNVYHKTAVERIAQEEKEALIKFRSDLIDLVSNQVDDGNEIALKNAFPNNADASESFYTNISKYLNPNWKVYRSASLKLQGIIAFQNISTGVIDFVQLCPQHSMLEYNMDTNTDLLAGKTKNVKNMPNRTIGNAYKLKTLLAISNWLNMLPDNNKIKIGDVMVVSSKNGVAKRGVTQPFVDCIKELQRIYPEQFSEVYDNFTKKAEFISATQQLVDQLKDAVKVHSSRALNGFDNFDKLSLFEKRKKLIELQHEILMTYQGEVVSRFTGEDFNPEQIRLDTDAGKMYATCSRLINRLNGFINDDPETVTKYGLTLADTVSELYNISFGNPKTHTDQNRKITGLLGGISTASAYNNPSVYIDFVNKTIREVHDAVKTTFVQEINEANEAAIEFIQYEIEHGVLPGVRLTDSLVGAHNKAYKRLLQKTADGNDYNFQFKNPYTDPSLNDGEKKFLKQLLWNITRRTDSMNVIKSEYKKLSFKEMSNNSNAEANFKDALRDYPNLLRMPLRPSSKLQGKASLMADFISGKRKGKEVWERVQNGLVKLANPADLAIDQLNRSERKIANYQAFNIYRESATSRESILENRTIDDFELNMNYLQNDVVLQYIKESYDKQLLPLLRNVVIEMQLMEKVSGVDMSKQLDGVKNAIKKYVYGTNLIENELKEVAGGVGILKQVFSSIKLGGRALLGVKELTVGKLKNVSTVAAGLLVSPSGNKVSVSNLMRAVKEVVPEGVTDGRIGVALGKQMLGQFRKIGHLNNLFQIVDRDMNSIVSTVSADRYGIAQTELRALYYFSVRPDWYNRMKMFIACMIQDGCYNAYIYNPETNTLEYDMSKDERFSEFWANRYSSNLSEKAKDQKALYMAMMEEFQRNYPDLHYGEVRDENGRPIYSKLPKAYNSAQMASMKEQLGMLYGMYDHEEKSDIENESIWHFFTQMLTYWPGEMHRYFAKEGQTSIGSYQKVRDLDGNVLYWNENHELTTESKDAEGNDRQMAMQFSGFPVEGLFISFATVIGSALKGSYQYITGKETDAFKKITNDRLRRSGVFVFNILMKVLIGYLVALLYQIFKENQSDEIDAMTGAAILVTKAAEKASKDIDFYESAVKPIAGFNIAGTQFMTEAITNTLFAIARNERATQRLIEEAGVVSDFSFSID